MRPTPGNYAEARRLLAPVVEATPAGGLIAVRYHHDHDEELGCYWFGESAVERRVEPERPHRLRHRESPPNIQTTPNVLEDARDVVRWTREMVERGVVCFGPVRRPIRRSDAYWVETGALVMEYFVLQAGAAYNDTLRQGFISWLQRSPGERRQYEEGDDMKRAAMVDWFLKVVR
jgi:hypothetical protein